MSQWRQCCKCHVVNISMSPNPFATNIQFYNDYCDDSAMCPSLFMQIRLCILQMCHMFAIVRCPLMFYCHVFMPRWLIDFISQKCNIHLHAIAYLHLLWAHILKLPTSLCVSFHSLLCYQCISFFTLVTFDRK